MSPKFWYLPSFDNKDWSETSIFSGIIKPSVSFNEETFIFRTVSNFKCCKNLRLVMGKFHDIWRSIGLLLILLSNKILISISNPWPRKYNIFINIYSCISTKFVKSVIQAIGCTHQILLKVRTFFQVEKPIFCTVNIKSDHMHGQVDVVQWWWW